MAEMYPERLPEEVSSEAERKLFTELAAQLPDDVAVLHSVQWLERVPRRYDLDGEIDFLIVDRDRGILILEVKGGVISRDPSMGGWASVNRHGKIFGIKDPFRQAVGSKHILKRLLDNAPATRPFALRYRLQHAVAFPDVLAEGVHLGVEADPSIVLDKASMNDLQGAVERALGEPPEGYRINKEAFGALKELLVPRVSLPLPGLLGDLVETQGEYVRLTKDQHRYLDLLSMQPRAKIAGPAGSGKTFLAIEKARRLAHMGQRVLFTCFNRALADWVREELRRSLGPIENAPFVHNYHDMAELYCKDAGVRLPDPEIMSYEEKGSYYNELLPEAFLTVVASLREAQRFDAIIADEGQDFDQDWWIHVESLLRDPAQGTFYIFYDDNQRLWDRGLHLPIGGSPYLLSENLRNTRTIHKVAMRYHSDATQVSARDPRGREPRILPVEADSLKSSLVKTISDLVSSGKGRQFSPEQIVVLTPRSQKNSVFQDGEPVGGALRLSWRDASPGMVRIRNVYAFKGLEAPIVILVEPEHARAALQNQILYVALSRATYHLIVLGKLAPPGVKASASEGVRVVAGLHHADAHPQA